MEVTSVSETKHWHRWLGGGIGVIAAVSSFSSAIDTGQVSFFAGCAGYALAAIGWFIRPPRFSQPIFQKYQQLVREQDPADVLHTPGILVAGGLAVVLLSILFRWLS